MATEAGSSKSAEQQSEALSRGPQRQSKVPVPPRPSKKGKRKGSAVSSKDRKLLSDLITKLQIEAVKTREEAEKGLGDAGGPQIDLWWLQDVYLPRNQSEQARLMAAMKRGITPELVKQYPELRSGKVGPMKIKLKTENKVNNMLDGSGGEPNVDTGRGQSLWGEQVTVLDTQQQPKDMANKWDILDGGDEAEDDIGRGRYPALEEQVPIIDSKLKPEMEVDAVIRPDTNESPTSFSIVNTDESSTLEPVLSCGPEIQSKVPVPPPHRRTHGDPFLPPEHLLQQQCQSSVYNRHEIYPPGTHEDAATIVEVQFKNLDLSGSKLAELDCGKSLSEEQVMVLETQLLPNDMSNKLDILDGGGDKAEVEMARAKALSEERETLKRQQSLILSELESCVQVLKELVLKDLIEAGTGAVNFYPEMRIKELSVVYRRTSEAIHNLQHVLKSMPNWVRDEVKWKQMAEAGMEDGAKSLMEKLVSGPLPHEKEMEGGSGKQQQQSQFLPRDPDIQSSDQHMIELKVDKQKLITEVEMDDMDIGKSSLELAMEKEEMAAEEENFACYRTAWESSSCGPKQCGFFEDITQLSSMHLTHLTPNTSLDCGFVAETLQILSIKLTEIKGGFKLPLSLYGVVAARDIVDNSRNLLFSCSREMPQRIRQHDPFLRLIGPSRAILCRGPVDFEIQLKVEHGAASRDRALISATRGCYPRCPGVHTICFENRLCKIELCFELLLETVQATICSIRVVKQGTRQRVERKCRVACSTTSYSRKIIDGKPTYVDNAPSGEVVLIDPYKQATPSGSEGYLDLSRRVVSVEFEGSLHVVVQAYSSSGGITAEGHVSLPSKSFGFSQKKFNVDDAQLEITVAWSLLVVDKDDISGPVGV